MFKWLTGLFGSSKNTETVVETAAKGIYNGLDMLVYTNEEKAQALAEGRKVFLKFVDKAYDQNSIRSVTRRWLAFLVVGPTIVFLVLSAIFHGIGTFGSSQASIDYAKYLFSMAQVLVPWAGGVLIFYFGPHLIGAARKK
jgi:hypothetical protein